ncbi:Abi-alpha family protein [Labrenzia sp. DG1229]|uniref:Abi-alpha family protein n=1 Tax=Labrenzia sp. DG1229 TaxID=681847 RepID=UPI00048E0B6E|nr:Abi-alpha family protein [Labrenzia sp. DG1229]
MDIESKTVDKLIDKTSDLGKWLDKIFGPSITDGVGIFHDKLKYIRLEKAIDLHLDHVKSINERGIKNLRPIPPKILLPIFENATLEEDENLHELWVSLLTSARDADGDEVHKSFVSILSELTPKDAEVLAEIADRWPNAVKPMPPSSYKTQSAPYLDEKAIGFLNFESIEESLTNLARQGLIREANHLQDVLVPTRFDERLRDPLEVGKFSVQVRVGLKVCAVTSFGEGFIKAVIPPAKK